VKSEFADELLRVLEERVFKRCFAFRVCRKYRQSVCFSGDGTIENGVENVFFKDLFLVAGETIAAGIFLCLYSFR